ncbi:MAG: regulatory protein RecX [Gemmatimonadota bacterium]|nr:regulatory protein RecX [Gemmatimonadota bacterium]
MQEVTAINLERKGRGLKKHHVLCLDGEPGLTITEETYLKFGLSIGQILTEAEHREIETGDGVIRAREAALRLLNTRMRSRKELAQRLSHKKYSDEVIEQVLDVLSQAGVVDDDQFARAWVNDRLRLRPAGMGLLRRELLSKGISDEITTRILNEHEGDDETERAWMLLSKRKARYAGIDPQVARRRMMGFLARRGFDGQTMYTVVKKMLEETKG